MVDTEARVASVDGVELDLTRTEFDLLVMLMDNPRRVVNREALLEGVWGSWYGDDHVVEVHMSRLRSKVKAAGGPRIGVAVRGVGYSSASNPPWRHEPTLRRSHGLRR